MWFTSARRRQVSKNHAPSRSKRGTFVPRLEALEDRSLPSTTWTVLNTNDSGPGSLRAAIGDAQNGDTINFAGSLAGQKIMLTSTSGPLNITSNVTIDASGVGGVAVSGEGVTQVFKIVGNALTNSGPTVAMQDIDITNGKTAQAGGGILVQYGGNLTLTNCTVEHCESTQSGGGGIDSSDNAVLALTGCTIRDNIAPAGGGLDNDVRSTANATDTVFSDNTVNEPSLWGGGILNNHASQLTLTRCQILNNQGQGSGLGLANMGNFGASSSAVLTDCVIDGNRSPNVISSSLGGGIYNVGSILSLDHCSVTRNLNASGGGIESVGGELTLGYSWIDHNTGGGIRVFNLANAASVSPNPLTVADCTISNNQLDAVAFGSGVDGGAGIFAAVGAGETATIANSTIENNTAVGSGGGLLLRPSVGTFVATTGTVNVTNCTIAGNFAGGNGGGVYVSDAGQANLINCTVASNLGLFDPVNRGFIGAGIASDQANLTLQNTVVDGNLMVGVLTLDFHVDSIDGPFTALASNYFDLPRFPLTLRSSGGTLPFNFGGPPPSDGSLGPLQDNGGPAVGAPGHTHALDTMAPLPLPPFNGIGVIPSPALVDQGFDPDPLTGLPLVADERGVLRDHPPSTTGTHHGPDIGAYQHLAPQVADIHWAVAHAAADPQTIPNSAIALTVQRYA
jgi:hypothetical protein